ncbi:ribokinase [Pseudothioclava arenosa]|uniref:Ribokinase n=1 Tax=Pseudothioclava arenosa TaxID=1795308 RepID=A0A2A4CQW1_9RHOB|nr:ribokinase [Pseudothioclava arenosa]PCD76642.1 ribokinase [Pseudothioclava arenosa]
MTVFNLGSINTDHFYRLAHLPAPGETLAAQSYARGLGGKGANQSVAAACAGAEVRHIGAIGPEGGWMVERLTALGVDCRHVAQLETVSGHAIINIDAAGENAIVIVPGANRAIPEALAREALAGAGPGDVLILQNETSLQVETARFAQEQGLFVVYSAAPFEADAALAVLPHVSLLLLNEIEAAQLCAALEVSLESLPVPAICMTRGAQGALWLEPEAGRRIEAPAFRVTPVDTTGAGDTFAGYLVAGLSQGLDPASAMRRASAAAALKVTRQGTAEAIPSAAETEAFLQEQSLSE